MIKAVLYDLDDTLYDYTYAHKIAMKAVFWELNKHMKMSYNRFMKLFKLSRVEIHKELSGTASAHNRVLYFQRLMEKTNNSIEPSIVLKLYHTYWDSLMENMRLKPGAIESLEYCREHGIKTAVVSDLTTSVQLRKLEKLGISKYIDVLVTSEEAGSEKPHSIMFLLTLNKLKVSAEEAVMVGDNKVADIEGANFVGLTTVLLKKGKMECLAKEDYKRPDHTIKNLKQLISIVESVNLKEVIEEGYIKFQCNFRKTKPVVKEKVRELNRYRQRLYNKGLIGAYQNKVGYGNLSTRYGEVIITGSATGNYNKLDNTHYSKITKYDIGRNELSCTGGTKASSESLTHEAIYECDKDIHAVIHVHSLKMWKKFFGKLPTTSKSATYGTPEIAYELKRLYEQGLREKQIAVLGGHKEGIVAFGKDLEEAYQVIMKYYNS
ncbi:MAG: HAD-IA family hydrolase [Candidatus Woesearchaeota archaeon]